MLKPAMTPERHPGGGWGKLGRLWESPSPPSGPSPWKHSLVPASPSLSSVSISLGNWGGMRGAMKGTFVGWEVLRREAL